MTLSYPLRSQILSRLLSKTHTQLSGKVVANHPTSEAARLSSYLWNGEAEIKFIGSGLLKPAEHIIIGDKSRHLVQQLLEARQNHGNDTTMAALVDTVICWLFWIPVVPLGFTERQHWVNTALWENKKHSLDRTLLDTDKAVRDAYELLGIPSWNYVQAYESIYTLSYAFLNPPYKSIINSRVPANDCILSGYVESYSCDIAIQFTPIAPPVYVVLDTGASISVIDRDFLLQQLPTAAMTKLPRPVTSNGIGNSRVLNEHYSLLDVFIPATMNGFQTLVEIHHCFLIASNLGANMLIGQDVAMYNRFIINPGEGVVTLPPRQGAIAPLRVIRRQYRQDRAIEDGH